MSPDATDKVVASAYRDLALKWHPDKYPDQSPEGQALASEVFNSIRIAKTAMLGMYNRCGYLAPNLLNSDEVLESRATNKVQVPNVGKVLLSC